MTRIRWTAGRSGVAHGHRSGRTLCHAPAIGERYAWPETSRCADCRALEAAARVVSRSAAPGISAEPEAALRPAAPPAAMPEAVAPQTGRPAKKGPEDCQPTVTQPSTRGDGAHWVRTEAAGHDRIGRNGVPSALGTVPPVPAREIP